MGQEFSSILVSFPLNTIVMWFSIGLFCVGGLGIISRISDRYILVELLKPFLAGVAAFLIIMVSNTLFIYKEMIVENNVPGAIVGQILLYSLPAIVVVTLPVAYMFATLLALGRLGRDSEIIALRACGVSLSRIILPVILFSLFISAVGFLIQEELVPWSNRQTVDLFKQVMKRSPVKAIKERVFTKADRRNFYVRDVDQEAETLNDVYVVDQSQGGYPQIISAQEAKRQSTHWLLNNGNLKKIDPRGYIDHEIHFKKMEIEMDFNENTFPDNLSVRELASSEASRLIAEKQARGENTLADQMDFYTKFSLPLATFFTILLAAPVGIIFSKMGNYFGVAISIALVFVWYVSYSIFTGLGKAGTVHPLLAAWVQNLAFGSVGSLLLMQLSGIKIYRLVTWPLWVLSWPVRKFVRLIRRPRRLKKGAVEAVPDASEAASLLTESEASLAGSAHIAPTENTDASEADPK